jgi:hypothetical protein
MKGVSRGAFREHLHPGKALFCTTMQKGLYQCMSALAIPPTLDFAAHALIRTRILGLKQTSPLCLKRGFFAISLEACFN